MTDSTQHPGSTPPEPDAADTRPLDVRFPQDGTAPLPRVETTPLADDTVGPATQAPAATRRPPARMSTVVWGLIILVVGVGVVARALGADFDNQLALIVLLAAAGVALVATSIVSAVRRR
ncbi:hypothetical protein [Sanguibacter suarezii]|uniref:hypothetical protein n=1 Tax=Sanguibacter suarezii TaxID=60921 RepID=UPI00082A8281|nr:hypothetical protein [Sanguibacter suarezii]